jgi:hypothetical protein
MLSAEPADQDTDGIRVGAHDRRSAMGEDGASHVRLGAPVELTDDGGIPTRSRPFLRAIERLTVAPSPI